MHLELPNQLLSGAHVKEKAMKPKLLGTLSSLATAKFTQRRKNAARNPGGLRGGARLTAGCGILFIAIPPTVHLANSYQFGGKEGAQVPMSA